VDHGVNRFRHSGVKQVGSHRRERRDAEKQYQQRCDQRTATHAGQTHDGADDKTGERIEPIHSRHNSAWYIIVTWHAILTAVLTCWTAAHCGQELRRGTAGRIPPNLMSTASMRARWRPAIDQTRHRAMPPEWGEQFFHLTDPDGHSLSFAWPLR
jgi:hypothetical protein